MAVISIAHHALRAWAKGSYPLEAAVELLVRGFGGRFAQPGCQWINDTDTGRLWLDVEAMSDDDIGGLSGGEQRFLRIVRSLAGGQPSRLGDDLPGLDRAHTRLVLAAVAHATGSHEDNGPMLFDDDGQPTGFAAPPGTLYPWPDL